MGETTREIEAQIDRTREDLAANIRELDHKVRSAADWREQFNAHPAVGLGLAFGGGLMLGHMLMRGSNGMTRTMSMSDDEPLNGVSTAFSPPRQRSVHQETALRTWDLMKGALLAVAATKLTELVDEMLPGFQEQFHRMESQSK